MSLYRIKPLEWEETQTILLSTGSMTHYQIRKRAGGGWFCTFRGQYGLYAESLEAGKAACEAHWRAKLAEVLEEADDWADTQRLDWLINESNEGRGWLEDSVWDAAATVEEPSGDDVGKLIRCVIDAAIKEGK